MFLSIVRVIKFALQDLGRNLSLSLMTVLILVLMLLSVNTLIAIRVLTSRATDSIKDQIDVSIYFDSDATEKNVKEIRDFVESFPEVVDVKYFSREEVEAQFRADHQDNAEIVSALDELGYSPLGPTMVVKTREPGDYSKIISALNVPEYESVIEAKTFGDTEKAIKRVDVITTQVEKFSYVLTGLFAVIAFLIIFNTIRVSIYTQRTEISIKKLVGASNWFIRGPYVFESLVFSAAAVIITYCFVEIASRFLDPYVSVVFLESSLLTNYFRLHIIPLFGGQFLVVLALTVLSSSLAMRRYLRV